MHASILPFKSLRRAYGYPLLEVGVERQVHTLTSTLDPFVHVFRIGRRALFRYSHTHDLFSDAKSLVTHIGKYRETT